MQVTPGCCPYFQKGKKIISSELQTNQYKSVSGKILLQIIKTLICKHLAKKSDNYKTSTQICQEQALSLFHRIWNDGEGTYIDFSKVI